MKSIGFSLIMLTLILESAPHPLFLMEAEC